MSEDIAWQVFFELHSNLPREGPGNDAVTAQALSCIPGFPEPPRILDLGCGPGMQTLALARLTAGQITAVDLYHPYLDELQRRAVAAGLDKQITVTQADMADLPFAPASFDLIWAEGSAYALGFANALQNWRSLLKHPGYLAVSEVSWTRADLPAPVVDFWRTEYPAIQSIEANLAAIEAAGYQTLAHFILPPEAWWEHYYTPLEQRLEVLERQYHNIPEAQSVFDQHRCEMETHRQYADYYGYVFYILQVED
ncbi:MAG: class I SAM-dependent methyltransferase [Cyanobacteria bacterium J06638_28]